MKKLFMIVPAMLLIAACHQGEDLPSTIPPTDNSDKLDSMHRPVPTDTDSMIEPRTGKPKTQETDTI